MLRLRSAQALTIYALKPRFQAGLRPLVVSDCCGDRALGPHEANLFDMAQKYAAVMPLEQALADIAALPGAAR